MDGSPAGQEAPGLGLGHPASGEPASRLPCAACRLVAECWIHTRLWHRCCTAWSWCPGRWRSPSTRLATATQLSTRAACLTPSRCGPMSWHPTRACSSQPCVLQYLDLAVDICFWLDVAVNFRTGTCLHCHASAQHIMRSEPSPQCTRAGYLDDRREVHMQPGRVAARYLATWCLVDLASVFPFKSIAALVIRRSSDMCVVPAPAAPSCRGVPLTGAPPTGPCSCSSCPSCSASAACSRSSTPGLPPTCSAL